jgi:hypothetical protein
VFISLLYWWSNNTFIALARLYSIKWIDNNESFGTDLEVVIAQLRQYPDICPEALRTTMRNFSQVA